MWKKLLMQIIRTMKEFVKVFEIKKLGEYHDLFVQSDTLLLADAFESFSLKYMNLILQNFFRLLE